MTFEEAGQRFAHIQTQYRAGALPPAHYHQLVAELRVRDPQGRWWQIDPNSSQWLMWNGSQWAPAAPAQPHGHPHPLAQPHAQSVTVQPKPAAPAIWEGLASVLPGFVIEMLQRWPVYQKDPALLAGFAVPSMLPAVLLPLTPAIGRAVSILIVLGCLAWLSWPVISQWSEIVGNAKGVQAHAGRGLVGVSLLYLIPRIWRAGA